MAAAAAIAGHLVDVRKLPSADGSLSRGPGGGAIAGTAR
jgi:hypothetical protein